MYEKIGRVEQENMRQSIEFLEHKAEFWNFSKLLAEVYEGSENLQKRLARKFREYGQTENEEQIARKIRNWLHGRNLPSDREELFKICFALGLDENKAGIVLGITAENGIHFRNPRELIYAFCLKRGIDYPRAKAMVQELWGEELPTKVLGYKLELKETRNTENRDKMTSSIRNEFKRLDTEADLRLFIEEYKLCFGCHHNTAYRKFVKMLSYLLFPGEPDINLPSDKEYSVERVVREYLRMGIPYEKRIGCYNKIQREIKRHWPTAKTINEMYSRKTDVDRKTLLLLYLATEGMLVVQNGSREKRIKEHRDRIDMMLSECGMALLNLHSPFDYLIMQAIRKENEEDFMSHRMEWMLRALFTDKYSVAYVAEKQKNTGGKENG